MIAPFPYHKLKRHGLECLHCQHPATTVEGPPYCTLHKALTGIRPKHLRDPDLDRAATKAAQHKTNRIRRHRQEKK